MTEEQRQKRFFDEAMEVVRRDAAFMCRELVRPLSRPATNAVWGWTRVWWCSLYVAVASLMELCVCLSASCPWECLCGYHGRMSAVTMDTSHVLRHTYIYICMYTCVCTVEGVYSQMVNVVAQPCLMTGLGGLFCCACLHTCRTTTT